MQVLRVKHAGYGLAGSVGGWQFCSLSLRRCGTWHTLPLPGRSLLSRPVVLAQNLQGRRGCALQLIPHIELIHAEPPGEALD